MDFRGRECVVLLHGLARTSRSMRPMARFLEREGFAVSNLSYPSTRFPIEELAAGLEAKLEGLSERWGRLHFVTHSMGGIVLRQLRASGARIEIGRCVMLSPPSRGSQVVDRLGGLAAFGKINGPAGRQLVTGRDGLCEGLGPVDFECGVLTGNRTVNPILSLMLPRPNDGKVAVSHAGVEGQADFKVLPASHPFIMRDRFAQANTLAFLRNGAFLAEET